MTTFASEMKSKASPAPAANRPGTIAQPLMGEPIEEAAATVTTMPAVISMPPLTSTRRPKRGIRRWGTPAKSIVSRSSSRNSRWDRRSMQSGVRSGALSTGRAGAGGAAA